MYVYVCICMYVFKVVVNRFLFELFHGGLYDKGGAGQPPRVMLRCSECLKMRRSGIKRAEPGKVIFGWGKLPHSRCKLSGDLEAVWWDFACENRSFAMARGRREFCVCAKVPI